MHEAIHEALSYELVVLVLQWAKDEWDSRTKDEAYLVSRTGSTTQLTDVVVAPSYLRIPRSQAYQSVFRDEEGPPVFQCLFFAKFKAIWIKRDAASSEQLQSRGFMRAAPLPLTLRKVMSELSSLRRFARERTAER